MPLPIPCVRGHHKVTTALPAGGGPRAPVRGTFCILHAWRCLVSALCSDKSPAPGTALRSSAETSAVPPTPDPGLEHALSLSVLSLFSL